MTSPAAKKGDQIVSSDTHTVWVLAGSTEVQMKVKHAFNGIITKNVSSNVNIMGSPAATVSSVATDSAHLVPPPGSTRFENPPSGEGKITKGSGTVWINGQPAARNADVAETCNDPSNQPVGKVVATGSVLIG